MLLIQRLRAEIDRAVGLAKIQKTQFDSGIVLETEPTKSAMIAAQKRQIAGAEATLAIAEKSGIKWKPLLPVIDKSPAALRATATAELQRLAKLPLANMRKSVELAAAGFEAVSAKNLSDAAVKCQEAEGLWSANEMLVRLKPMLAASKVAETKAETAKVEAAKGKAEATPTPILNRVKSWFSF